MTTDRQHLDGMRDVLLARRQMIDDALELLEALQDVTSISVSMQLDGTANHEDLTTVTTAFNRYAENRRGNAAPREQNPDANPGGVAGVRRVLERAPGEGFSAEDLASTMLGEGWITKSPHPSRAARAAANRLRKESPDKFFLRNGHFVYQPDGDGRPLLLEEGDGGSDAAPE